MDKNHSWLMEPGRPIASYQYDALTSESSISPARFMLEQGEFVDFCGFVLQYFLGFVPQSPNHQRILKKIKKNQINN
jgi:hypothetical protein